MLVSQSFSGTTSSYKNVSILDFVGARDEGGGGDNFTGAIRRAKLPVRLAPPTNRHPTFLQARFPSCRRINGVRALKEDGFLVKPKK